MSNEIIIALITAFSALAISLLGFIYSVVNARSTSRRKIKNEQIKKSVESLNLTIKLTQSFRNSIIVLLSSGFETITAEEALELISNKIEEVMKVSEKVRPDLNDNEWKVYHHIKNQFISVSQLWNEKLKGKSFVSDIPKSDRDELQILNGKMAEHEIRLQQLKNERIVDLL